MENGDGEWGIASPSLTGFYWRIRLPKSFKLVTKHQFIKQTSEVLIIIPTLTDLYFIDPNPQRGESGLLCLKIIYDSK